MTTFEQFRKLWPDWDPEALKRIHQARKRVLEALPWFSGPEPDMVRCFELVDNYRESTVFNVLRQQREYLRLHPNATAAEVIEAVDPVTGYLRLEQP